MDLISRKSVAKKMLYRRNYVGRPSDPDCIIADEPSVTAVPLDKLCEWLDKNAGMPLVCFFTLCENCKYKNDKCFISCWKALLEKWMEEQDATD